MATLYAPTLFYCDGPMKSWTLDLDNMLREFFQDLAGEGSHGDAVGSEFAFKVFPADLLMMSVCVRIGGLW